MKKVISWILCAVMIFSALYVPTMVNAADAEADRALETETEEQFEAAKPEENIQESYDKTEKKREYQGTSGIDFYIEDGTLYVTGSGPMEDYVYENDVLAPWSDYANEIECIVVGEGITSIGESAFTNMIRAYSVSLPTTLTSIGNGAFIGCENLCEITVPEDVTSIGEYAFFACTSLESIELPEGLASIEPHTFENCYLLSGVVIPDGVTSIGEYAFNICLNLGDVVLPDSVETIGDFAFAESGVVSFTPSENLTEIGSYAFKHCIGLDCFEIPAGVTVIGEGAFQNCSNLYDIAIPTGVTEISYGLFDGCRSLEYVSIPSSVISIGMNAFCNCWNLQEVIIPESVTTIAGRAFMGCTSLTEILFPEGVTSIGEAVLGDCRGLESIFVAEDNPYYCVEGNCLVEKHSGKLIAGCKNSVIPDDVTYIGSYTFYGITDIESIELPEGLVSIGQRAFSGCEGLKEVSLPDSLKLIGESAFGASIGLTEITIPSGVTGIGDCAFEFCENLTSVYFTEPDSIADIGEDVFYCCPLVTIYCGLHSSVSEYAADHGIPFVYASEVESITVKSLPDKTVYPLFGRLETEGLVISVEFTNGESVDLTEGFILDLYDFTEAGKKTVTGSYNGVGFAFNVTVDGSTVEYPESSHDYPVDSDEVWVVHKEDAIAIDVTFSDETSTEEGWDFITILDQYDNEVGKYTGTELAGKTISISGDTVKIRLTSDSSVCEYGFAVTDMRFHFTNVIDHIAVKSGPDKDLYPLYGILDRRGIVITVFYKDGTSFDTAEGFTIGVYSFNDSGVKTLYVEYQGLTAPFEVTVDADFEDLPESAHNYEDGTDETWSVGRAGAALTCIKFSEDTETENNYDFIYIYDRDFKEVGKYSGTELAGKSLMVNSDIVYIRLTSDNNFNYYGFKVTGISYINGESVVDSYVKQAPDKVLYPVGGVFRPKGMVLSVELTDGTTVDISSGYEVVDYDFSSTGVKQVTISFMGSTASVNVTVDDGLPLLPESDHEYANSTNKVWTLHKDGADYVYMVFSEFTETEENFDRIEIYDKDNNLVDSYSGTSLAGQNVLVEGDTAKIRLVSDETVTDYGFDVTSVAYFMNEGEENERIEAYGNFADNLYYTLDENGTLDISGFGPMGDYGYTGAPWRDYADSIKNVVIHDGITSIGDDAFVSCFCLESVVIPESVTSIGGGAFFRCESLMEVDIPESVTSIGGVALAYCSSLKNLYIHAGLTDINDTAFQGVSGLETITVEEGNEVYRSEGNCLIKTDENKIILGCKNSVIPDDESVTEIYEFAFYGISGLTSIVIPDNITVLNYSAFSDCEDLTSIEIPDSVEYMGEYLFCNCTSLEEVNIPEGIPAVEFCMFANCKSLTSIELPMSITEIGNYAFEGCSSLREITMSYNIKTIMPAAFTECDNLEKVYFLGTQQQWESIDIREDEVLTNPLLDAEIIFITCFIKGDISGDGKVNAIDANMMNAILAGVLTPDENQSKAADLDNDGKTTATDAVLMIKAMVM